VRLSYTIICS